MTLDQIALEVAKEIYKEWDMKEISLMSACEDFAHALVARLGSQEPVAWMYHDGMPDGSKMLSFNKSPIYRNGTPLYDAPVVKEQS